MLTRENSPLTSFYTAFKLKKVIEWSGPPISLEETTDQLKLFLAVHKDAVTSAFSFGRYRPSHRPNPSIDGLTEEFKDFTSFGNPAAILEDGFIVAHDDEIISTYLSLRLNIRAVRGNYIVIPNWYGQTLYLFELDPGLSRSFYDCLTLDRKTAFIEHWLENVTQNDIKPSDSDYWYGAFISRPFSVRYQLDGIACIPKRFRNPLVLARKREIADLMDSMGDKMDTVISAEDLEKLFARELQGIM